MVCFGFNIWAFAVKLPNGEDADILGIMDYVSNSVLMPIVAIITCLLVGWVVKPKYVIEEVEKTGTKFGRKMLYTVMVKVIAPILLIFLFLKSIGVINI